MTPEAAPTTAAVAAMADDTVAELAELYLGNILYAIELAAVSLEGQGRRDDAAFYRGIARKLAEAHGQARGDGREARDEGAPRGAY
jgi:cytosine/adenosine deaminase-related metal-dependent hydrolase